MNKDQKEIAQYLFIQYMEGEATQSELAELNELLQSQEDNKAWLEMMEEIYTTQQPMAYDQEEWQPMLDSLLKQNAEHDLANATPRSVSHEPKLDEPKKRTITMRFAKYAAAAAIIICILTVVILSLSKDDQQTSLAKTTTPATDVSAPLSTKATIKLADGTIITLDSLNKGLLAKQHGANVIKNTDGSIAYDASASLLTSDLSPEFNTLTNPRGSSVIDITLADGSRVWLNAESSITYPTTFTTTERKVELIGEGYFEIAKVNGKKFIVEANGVQTEVLGTQFNINSYANETDTKITLIEGSVQVSASSVKTSVSSVVKKLNPGEQALINKSTNQQINVSTADTNETLAWKEDRFYFNSTDIQSISRQLERWYDVDINLQPGINDKFTGIISRKVNASKVFAMLQKTGTLKVKIEGKKISITK